jgi:hypothetical protein
MTTLIKLYLMTGVVALSTVGAQEQQAPISVSDFKVAGQGSVVRVSAKLKNISAKGIVAYVVSLQFRDGAKVVEDYWNSQVDTLMTSEMKPGAEWEIDTESNNPQTRDYATLTKEAHVDWVLLADGTAWAPDTLKESQRIKGEPAGVRDERRRLPGLLKSGGPDKLIADLSRELPELPRH